MSYYFWIITSIKNMNNFQRAKVQPEIVASHLLDFLPISKVSLIKRCVFFLCLLCFKKISINRIDWNYPKNARIRVFFDPYSGIFYVVWSSYYWKSDSHLLKNYFICFKDSPLKMMKNAFHFILKVIFVLKIF